MFINLHSVQLITLNNKIYLPSPRLCLAFQFVYLYRNPFCNVYVLNHFGK